MSACVAAYDAGGMGGGAPPGRDMMGRKRNLCQMRRSKQGGGILAPDPVAVLVVLFGLLLLPLSPSRAATPAAVPGEVVGEVVRHRIGEGETFLRLAARYDVGYMALRAANPDIDPWVPPVGAWIVIPTRHIAPFARGARVIVNRGELHLYAYDGQGRIRYVFPVSLGRDGLETPLGEIAIGARIPAPAWYPTEAHRRENPGLPKAVPPGPDNPLGRYALRLGQTSYLLHGTNHPLSIGRTVSRGCIRLYPRDIAVLFDFLARGDRVRIIDAPVKIGIGPAGDRRPYLEVAPSPAQRRALDAGHAMPFDPVLDITEVVRQALPPALLSRIDWKAVRQTGEQRRGLPVAIGPGLDEDTARILLTHWHAHAGARLVTDTLPSASSSSRR